MDRGAWGATVHRVAAKSRTHPSTHTKAKGLDVKPPVLSPAGSEFSELL